jgi:hypothetical protein
MRERLLEKKTWNRTADRGQHARTRWILKLTHYPAFGDTA